MADRTLRFDRRMSDAEALMWSLEADPSLRSTFLNVTFLDGPPDVDRFRTRMARAVAEIPRLRQRVAPTPGHLAPPEWADDPAFDLDFHVRHIALPRPGSDRQLLDWAALHYQDPFDRARPLWQYTVVDGLDHGRAALLAKMHHTITDGVGGVRLSAMFIDLEREPSADDIAPNPEPAYAPIPEGIVASIAEAIAHNVRRQLGLTRRAAHEAANAVLHPRAAIGRAGDLAEIARSVVRQAVVTDPARSPLWGGHHSLGRRFDVLRIDLDRLRAVARDLGGTVNDAFVCGVAGGAGAYHREMGVEIEELRMAMPVSTREDRSAGGNAFAPARVLVPCGVKDPVERFRLVKARLSHTKRERALALTEEFAGIVSALPTALVVRVARQITESVDFTTSNVRGAPFDLFIGGAEILSNHPMGPTAGTAFNATVLSYRGSLDMGIACDTAAIEDPDLLRECIASSFDELLGQ